MNAALMSHAVGRCHHFMLLLIAILRSRRIPARVRFRRLF
jgi:transglutaminase-like putative cysteine protease